jgi:hypothetical protein
VILFQARIRTDIDRRLLLASFACLVLRCKRCPVEWSYQPTISKLPNLDLPLSRLLSFELGETVETCCGRRTGEKECLEKHIRGLKAKKNESKQML